MRNTLLNTTFLMIIWDMIDMSWKNKRHVPNHQPVIYEKHMVKHYFLMIIWDMIDMSWKKKACSKPPTSNI